MDWHLWRRNAPEPMADVPALETRQEQTDAVLAALIRRGGSPGRSTADVHATAALEACAGTTGRAFAAVDVSGPAMIARAITPDCLEIIGRELTRRGELVLLIDMSSGELVLLVAQSFDVDGPPMPSQWRYRITVGGPSRTWTWTDVPADDVCHFRYATDPSFPWRGQSPVNVAAASGRLSAETVEALGDEASGPRGSFLPLPGQPGTDDDANVINKDSVLQNNIRDAKGRLLQVEAGDFDIPQAGQNVAEWMQRRFGMNMPAASVDLAGHASKEIMAACGYNPSLFLDADAASLREAWRLALFGTIEPLGKKVLAELRFKLDAPELMFDWTPLAAADIASRARAFRGLAETLPAEVAAKNSGIMLPAGFTMPAPADDA